MLAVMNIAITVLLVIVGFINFAPVVAAISRVRVEAMYGLQAASPDLEILLRHRAVLFGIVGTIIILSGFVPRLRVTAMACGLASMVSFVVLVLSVPGHGQALRKVALIDGVALVLLVVAAALTFLESSQLGA